MMESDELLRQRMYESYGWGAFMGVALETKGRALDNMADMIGLRRKFIVIPPESDWSPYVRFYNR